MGESYASRNAMDDRDDIMKIYEIIGPKTTNKKLGNELNKIKNFKKTIPNLKKATWISSNAKNFNHAAKDHAMTMHMDGRTPQEVYAKTGMYKGQDGAWMSRISDKNMKIKKGLKPGTTHRLGDVLTHDEYFKNYPDAADIKYKVRDNRKEPELGGVAALDGTYIGMSTHMRDKNGKVVKVDDKTLKAKTGHELQHIIQTMEPGMSKGGSPDSALTKEITNTLKTKTNPWFDKRPDWRAKDAPRLDLGRKTIGKNRDAVNNFNTYKSIYGEIVAGNTAKTSDWSQKKMDKTFPVLGPDTAIVTVPKEVDKRTVPNSGKFQNFNPIIDPVVTKVTPKIKGPNRNSNTYTTYMNKDFGKK
jgi:hypothetical protein